MPRQVAAVITCWATLCLTLAAQSPTPDAIIDEALSAGLVKAMRAALPFPAATSEGTPVGGGADAVWTVRWPEAGDARIEVLANPLNAGNRDRALKAEQEIQKSAMNAQLRSQGDYERAVKEFERTGRASTVREISLRDDGLAGERYDAESQLTIVAQAIAPGHQFTVSTSALPAVSAAVPGLMVVRVAANAYQEPESSGLPGMGRYCPEQAWVFFGQVGTPVITRRAGADVDISMTESGEASSRRRGSVVWISGNAGLVEQVLMQADWAVLRALVEG
jgi:hypothetical protein